MVETYPGEMRRGSGANALSWDPNGNLLKEEQGASVTDYQWGPENHLTQVSGPGGTESYVYRSDGKRARKETSGGVTLFLWDGENLLREQQEDLSLVARYTDYPGYWGGLASQHRGGGSSFYGFDLQASARVLVSVGGAVTDSYTFKAFGEEIAGSGSSVNPLRYVGAYGYYREAAERYYVRARWLDLAQGRWLSRDPLESPARIWYLYGWNRPITDVDPSGLTPEFLWVYRGFYCLLRQCVGCLRPLQARVYEDISYVCPKPIRQGAACDAMVHCTLSCLMARECGTFCAWMAAQWHETPCPHPSLRRYDCGHPVTDSWLGSLRCMDHKNNREGFDCATAATECDKCCLSKALRGNLIVILPVGPGEQFPPPRHWPCGEWGVPPPPRGGGYERWPPGELPKI
jgi:RHS repeat-associated protein